MGCDSANKRVCDHKLSACRHAVCVVTSAVLVSGLA
jgi:hypothetical protein